MLPRSWHDFSQVVGTPHDMVAHLHDAVFGTDAQVAEDVARAWMRWSGEVVCYAIDSLGAEGEEAMTTVLAKTRIELHYARHGYFIRENQLIDDVGKLPNVPINIIHGQRDLTCTPDAAWTLHQAVPWSTLKILRTAGHLSGESLITDALIDAADEMARTLGACRT
jgi:proline iminopeptidase